MKRVELIVGDYPNQVSLDLNKDSISIALQYSIDDIRDIDKKNSNYSKTITLPGTDKNNITFGNLFDINSTFDIFNPNLKVSARIVVDSSPVLEGYLQLNKVVKLNNADLQGNKVEYNVVVFDDSIDFIQTLGDKKLRGNADINDDLDLSEFDHTLDRATIENAWYYHDWPQIYQYPLMDKVGGLYEGKDFRPAFFHKGLLMKCAEKAGYTLEGPFIDNEDDDPTQSDFGSYHKELILWDGNIPKLRDEVAEARSWKSGMDSDYTQLDGDHSSFKDFSQRNFEERVNLPYMTPPDFYNDVDNSLSTAGGGSPYTKWTVANTGEYEIVVKVRVRWKQQGSGTMRYSSGIVIPNKNSTTNARNEVKLKATLREGGSYVTNRSAFVDNLESGIPSGSSVNIDIYKDLEFRFDKRIYNAGDEINLRFQVVNTIFNDSGSVSSTNKFAWTPNSSGSTTNMLTRMTILDTLSTGERSHWFNIVEKEEAIDDGSEIELSNYLPKDIKQKDLLSDIIRRYNVYVRKHPTKDKTLILESRDDFYKNNVEVIDWTFKKDYSTEDKIQFLSDLQNKEILFTYKEANDLKGADDYAYNENYKASTGDIYGQKLIEFENDFVKGTKKIESIFSTTPLVYRGDEGNNVVVPAVSVNTGKRKPVLAYWGGRLFCRDENGNNSSFDVEWSDATINYSLYPYAGHLDDPFEPTIDIHYGEVTYEYHGTLLENTTDNTLFNRYWRNYVNQISTGKIVTSKFYLKETDINYIKDNMNARIFVKDSYYNINKIVDYKPLEDGLTTVELLYITEGSTFDPSQGTQALNLSPMTFRSLQTVGPFMSNVNNLSSSRDMLILGQDNSVDSESSGVITGDNNIVSASSSNISISGDDNIIESQTNNVTISGDNNIVVGDSNYINILGSNQTVSNSYTNLIDGNNIISGTTSISGQLIIDDVVFSNLWLPGIGLDSVVQFNSGAPNTASSYYSITTGVSNTNDGGYSGILGGASNTINTTSTGTTILGGEANATTAGNSGTVGGSFNIITGNGNASIVAGSNNTLSGKYSTIVGGSVNTNSGLHSSVIGGTNNNISGDRSVILGGTLIVGTQDKTVYVPKLVITETYIPTGTSDTNGETGEISYDGSYVYIKTASGWLRSALSSF